MPALLAAAESAEAIVIDPSPRFEISPWLYMQFMEPLGTTDSSVEAAWDYDIDDWRKDFVACVQDLKPDVIRWGGLFSQYYKWREGIGPADKRPLMRNYIWGGRETNRAGTHEFVDLCRRTGAEPLYCVNFLSEGEQKYWRTREGNRSGDAREAADWVSYANDPGNRERQRNGSREPFRIHLWQIGNETSYSTARFPLQDAIRHTIEFASAMKQRDPSIRLIGWGDRGRRERNEDFWAPAMLEQAGEHLDLIAFHMMGQSPRRGDTVLRGTAYQRNPEQAWQELLELSDRVETRVSGFEELVRPYAPRISIAVTEGHLSLAPHNANPLLTEWLCAVYHARSMNTYQRHGDLVRMATAADFEGNRWTVNAVMVLREAVYLNPVGSVMRLFRRHNGTHGVGVSKGPSNLDIAASRSGQRIFLHVANKSYTRNIRVRFAVTGSTITGGRVFEIAPEDPRANVDATQPDRFTPRERTLGPSPDWTFPKTSVSAVELDLG